MYAFSTCYIPWVVRVNIDISSLSTLGLVRRNRIVGTSRSKSSLMKIASTLEVLQGRLDLHATMQGLSTARLMVAVRNMSNSEVKWPNAMRKVNKVMS
jgi:hypothetical protein